MICFGAKTDQEEENGICGSHIKNNNNKKKKSKSNGHSRSFDFFLFSLFFSFFSLRYTEIGPSEFVGARSKVLYSTRVRLGTKNTSFRRAFN